ncbi:HNH endonuclease [Nakamurella aerolata]|uniref:DUF222 domain-containing protein n=1 Tax=Nakamurella aerolata TaxID=1656892 RepID=A0A849A892_9ACTN|nr:DUF222 domain-containing protein [Nakamurella aerolata]NNG34690.1 DUF222 domain-containing protein [Nakamurella aerolata]
MAQGVSGGGQGSGPVDSVARQLLALEVSDHDRMDWLLAKLSDVLSESAERGGAATGAAEEPARTIDRIQLMERLTAQLSGAIAAESLEFANAERQRQLAAGVRTRDLGRGTAEQLAYARRISPVAASRDLAVASSLRQRFPRVYGRLRSGAVSWRQCQIVVTQTSHLEDGLAALADVGFSEALPGWNLRQTERGVRQAVYELDPQGATDRRGRAEADRRVTIRPMPDTMTMVSALLPVADGVATHARLAAAAEQARAAGDTRTKDQLMADLFVQSVGNASPADAEPVPADAKPVPPSGSDEDVTAATAAADTDAGACPAVLLNLTMSTETLLGADNGAGWLDGHGPIPGDLAREIAGAAEHLWVRRLLTDPITGVAVAVEKRRKAPREFTGLLRDLIVARDRECRQPFCDAPIRHADHIEPYARGGPTTANNGQGLCARGNYLKELPGWHSWQETDGSYVCTPTGHVYRTSPPRTNGPSARTEPVPLLRVHIHYPPAYITAHQQPRFVR